MMGKTEEQAREEFRPEAEKNVKSRLVIEAVVEAEKIKAQGEAEAYAAKKKVEAGLTPLEKAKIEMETKIGIAKALASVKFPDRMVIAGGSEHGGTNPFDAVGLQSLYDLSDKMAK